MNQEQLEPFGLLICMTAAKVQRDSFSEKRGSYTAEAAKIVDRMEPWPLRRLNTYRVKPAPGTDEETDPQD